MSSPWLLSSSGRDSMRSQWSLFHLRQASIWEYAGQVLTEAGSTLGRIWTHASHWVRHSSCVCVAQCPPPSLSLKWECGRRETAGKEKRELAGKHSSSYRSYTWIEAPRVVWQQKKQIMQWMQEYWYNLSIIWWNLSEIVKVGHNKTGKHTHIWGFQIPACAPLGTV